MDIDVQEEKAEGEQERERGGRGEGAGGREGGREGKQRRFIYIKGKDPEEWWVWQCMEEAVFVFGTLH